MTQNSIEAVHCRLCDQRRLKPTRMRQRSRPPTVFAPTELFEIRSREPRLKTDLQAVLPSGSVAKNGLRRAGDDARREPIQQPSGADAMRCLVDPGFEQAAAGDLRQEIVGVALLFEGRVEQILGLVMPEI
jgi:hypothetical protein